ncbi:hypothetical protein FACS18948_0690 [Clostridia bacterium]|nr:hypothetical protein FACS18948_0690 [Clostridia bacterium]
MPPTKITSGAQFRSVFGGGATGEYTLQVNVILPADWDSPTAGVIKLWGNKHKIQTSMPLFNYVGALSEFHDVHVEIKHKAPNPNEDPPPTEPTDPFVGAFCKEQLSTVKFNRCMASGSIHTQSMAPSPTGVGAGGYCGKAVACEFRDCTNRVSIVGRADVGGFVGTGSGNTFLRCYNEGRLTSVLLNAATVKTGNKTVENCGGMIGYAYDVCITLCVNFGKVIGESEVGGMAGYARQSLIRSCTNIEEVIAGSSSTIEEVDVPDPDGEPGATKKEGRITVTTSHGGIVGKAASSSIFDCICSGAYVRVAGEYAYSSGMGGIVGIAEGATVLANRNQMPVLNDNKLFKGKERPVPAGGIVGAVTAAPSPITMNVDEGSVIGRFGAGGIVGVVWNSGAEIRNNCVSSSVQIEATRQAAGGILGAIWGSGTPVVADNVSLPNTVRAVRDTYRVTGHALNPANDAYQGDPNGVYEPVNTWPTMTNNFALADAVMYGEGYFPAWWYNGSTVTPAKPHYGANVAQGANKPRCPVGYIEATACLICQANLAVACTTPNSAHQHLVNITGYDGACCGIPADDDYTKDGMFMIDGITHEHKDSRVSTQMHFMTPIAKIPAPGITFTLSNETGPITGVLSPAVSGANGELSICGLSPGVYWLDAVAPAGSRFKPHSRYLISVSNNGSVMVDGGNDGIGFVDIDTSNAVAGLGATATLCAASPAIQHPRPTWEGGRKSDC